MPDHGRLFDNFSRQASHAHGGSYFDTGFGHTALEDAHGKLFDLFGVPKDSSAHGERFDEFGWHDMPAIHGQLFDTDFKAPTAGTGKHGTTWFDVFRGGTEARYMYDGRDYEGTVIECNREFATVRSRDGQTHEVGLSQFLAYRTPNEHQAAPATPAAERSGPSTDNATAHGAHGTRGEAASTELPSRVERVSEGPGNPDSRSEGVPDGLMDTFTHLKSLAERMDDDDVEKISIGGKGCPECGHDTFKIPPKGPAHVVTCNGCGSQHRFADVAGHAIRRPNRTPGEERLHNQAFGKSVDATETAVQGSATSAKTVGHRANCPRGGSAPCGADVDGRCNKCGYKVRDHEAVGKISSGDLGISAPEREHKSTDHHSDQHSAPKTCPHCGKVIAELDEKADQGAPAHKCMAATLDVLKALAAA